MEIDNETNSSQIHRFRDKSLNIADLNKKRKLEAGQLGLPLSKHQCWKQSLSLPRTFDGIPEVEEHSPCTFKVKRVNVYDVSETGSAKDSNSYAEDSDSATSVHAGAKYLLCNIASSSSLDSGSSSQGSHYSSDGTTVASSSVEKEAPSSPGVEPELAENLKECLVEYGSDIDYLYSGYGNYTIEQYQDKEIEDILNSDEANPNVYVLSSGRWSVTQAEARQTNRKPTIDQEFEQYFSTLML